MKKTMTALTIFFLVLTAFQVNATAYDESNWYVTVDVEQVRDKIIPLIPEHKHVEADVSLREHFPQEVKHITMYGHSETEDDLSMVASGDLSGFEVNTFITDLMASAEVDDQVDFTLVSSLNHNGSLLEHFNIGKGKDNKSFYAAKINNEHLVISFEESEVKNWIDGEYDLQELNNSGLVSVLVNIESAMAHMGADLSSNNTSFNSAIFKKITQFSASAYDSGNESLVIETALNTADAATAKQLEQVINGLVAMGALSNINEEQPELSALLAALNISTDDSSILISTELAYSLLSEIDFD